jgi:integrase
MPSGACTIAHKGKRGIVWYLKFRDAEGRQVKERLGKASEGWNKRKANAALRARLTDVERDAYVKPAPVTFASYADEWLDAYPAAKSLKRSTVSGYKLIINTHLSRALGQLKLEALTPERIERYVADKRREGLAPRTLNRHLNLLNLLLSSALKRGLIRTNPIAFVDRPREPRRRWRILTPTEVVRVERSFEELIAEAEDEEKDWREQARVIFVVLVGTGLRRGEALGLRWRAVHLADPDGAFLRVRETWVQAGADTPKSEAGERTVALGRKVAAELFEHRRRSRFDGDDECVFCSPTKGTPFDVARYAATFRGRSRARRHHGLRAAVP